MDDTTVTARNAKQLVLALRRFRKLKTYTQGELGVSAGVPQTSISKIEVGLVDPSLTTMFKILAALDLEIVVKARK